MFLRVKGGIDFDSFENKPGENVADIVFTHGVRFDAGPENEQPAGVSFEDTEHPSVVLHAAVQQSLTFSHLIFPKSVSRASVMRTSSYVHR